MEWTLVKPKEPGIYYYAPKRFPSKQFLLCQVSPVQDEKLGLYGEIISTIMKYYSYGPVKKMRGLWFGPLPSPGPHKM